MTKLSPLATACGTTIAKRLQSHYEEEQFGVKDIEDLDEQGFLPSAVANLGIGFLEFLESFYDNDGNYNDVGLTVDSRKLLERYLKSYGISI